MLPPFRVKKLIPRAEAGPSGYPGQNYLEYLQERSSGAGAADGIIRMSRQAYDELLEREPNAALTYLDEEDGDVVLVCISKFALLSLKPPPTCFISELKLTISPSTTGRQLTRTRPSSSRPITTTALPFGHS